jgi:23S rRNA pseudouridine955/2504/2580 synthase
MPLGKDGPSWVEADETVAGQRLDNWLARLLKGVPRQHIYRLLRTGQVRVNSARVDPTYRVQIGDRLRVPPVRLASRPGAPVGAARLRLPVLFEDEHLMALDKPAGVAVHGGSGISRGVIEEMRIAQPQLKFLELVHRLDRDTSGILLLAKKRAALVALHAALRAGRVRKTYTLLVRGTPSSRRQEVDLPLHKYVLPGGDRRVQVRAEGLAARTIFALKQRLGDYSLLEAELLTGRTHQIRVHAAHTGHPIAGDGKYGDFATNRAVARLGLKRMFLHAARLEFDHPASGERLALAAPLPADLAAFLVRLQPATTEHGKARPGQARE